MRRCYLDHNASSPLRPSVREALATALELVGNPSSIHREGRECRAALELARQQVAALVNAETAEIIFTSGGSEANQLALTGLDVDCVLVSSLEHASVLEAKPDALRIAAHEHGAISLEALQSALNDARGRVLVSVMLANNETGVIQPLTEIARMVKARGALLHCDAVQAAGRLPLDRRALGVDLLTLSAHKLGGPAGVGALIAAESLPLRALIKGGGQERGRRGGTENLLGAVGFGAAAAAALEERGESERLATLRDALEFQALHRIPHARVIGAGGPRLANTSCLALPGFPAETQLMALDLAGIAVSAGAACSSGRVRKSQVLAAMRVSPEIAEGAIRISLGWTTTAKDIDRFLEVWTALAHRRMEAVASGGSSGYHPGTAGFAGHASGETSKPPDPS